VAEAFRPWLEGCHHKPSPEQILALKVCDPAMGSGAFLVAVCRFLAGWLVKAWEDPDGPGFPPEFRAEWDKDLYARRLIAQRCLYGVDKNPFAVNLAKLSLWLVTLSKELPFTFVDHAFKCGDSLVGYSVSEIRAAMAEVQLGFLDDQNRLYERMGIERRESFGFDSLSDADYDSKKQRLEQQIQASQGLRQAGDLMVAAFFDAAKPKERADKQQVYLAMLSGAFNDEGLQDSIKEIRDRLASISNGINPFHWDLEFPEVFQDNLGFNLVLGNPPFGGIATIASTTSLDIASWLKQLHSGIAGQCDLSGHFFRRTWAMLAPGGSVALIATNTICQGDTRESGIGYICRNGGEIYFAIKRLPWPGQAAVVVSVLAIHAGKLPGFTKKINGIYVKKISSFLLAAGGDEKPRQLSANAGMCFKGCELYGQGFLFSDEPKSSLDGVGEPSPHESLRTIIAKASAEAAFVKDYIGGEDVNNNPLLTTKRKVIDFADMSLQSAIDSAPLLVEIVKKKVKPERETKAADVASYPWWKHWRVRQEMRSAIAGLDHCLVACIHQHYWQITRIKTNFLFANSLMVFACQEPWWLAVLQSNSHAEWMRWLGSSLKDDLRYTAADCFETFPFPTALLDSAANEPAQEATRQSLEALGEHYHQFRAELMVSNNEGLTSTYNRFHDPSETSSGLLQLRALHQEMDQAVLHAYGWSDVPTACGFGLDYLDTEEDAQLPEDLQERIASGDLFFWDAGDALDFQGQLQAYGAITGRRKLPWRYRWPDVVRDDVLARLLALNAERYEEEVAMGLHSKGTKPAAGAKRGRKPKAAAAATPPPAFQLEPEPLQIGLDLSGGR
jgi:hypothetical protein